MSRITWIDLKVRINDEMYEKHQTLGTYMRYGLKVGDREVPKAAKMRPML